MRSILLIAGMLLPFAALAEAPDAGAGGAGGPGSPAGGEQRFEQLAQRMRAARALGIAEALELDDAQANQVRTVLDGFDAQRTPLMRQLHDQMQLLRRAANGDAAAQAQVDQATETIFATRTKLQALDREMYQTLAKGLSAEKRARLAVFLIHFQGRFGMAMGARGGHHPGPGGWMTGGDPGKSGPAMGSPGPHDCGSCPKSE
jgi:Spy/CpxP family protein refolding chaperone